VRKKIKKKSWQIWQKHHLEYSPPAPEEIIVKISRTEHFFASRIEPYAKAHRLTRGFLKTIKYYGKKYGIRRLNDKT
jgi:hypothetical protein